LIAAIGSFEMKDGQRYTSYLLRLWLAGDSDPPQWRASLEDPFTGERKGFASLEALFNYLNPQNGLKRRQRQDSKEERKI
jgi:hypothetical protein